MVRRSFMALIAVLVFANFAASQEIDLLDFAAPQVVIQGFLDPDTSTIAGTEKIQLTNTGESPLTEIVFLLPANLGSEPNHYLSELFGSKGYYKNFDSSHTYVSGVRVNGKPAEFSLEEGPSVLQTYSLDSVKLIVQLGEILPGEETSVEIDFLTKIPYKRGDFGLSANGIFYLNGRFYPELLNPWDPLKRTVKRYEADFLLPSTLVVASNADYQYETSSGGIYKKVSLRYDYPVFDLAFAAGPGLFVKETTAGGVELYTYYLKDHEKQAVFFMQTAADVLQYYGENFGPYPKKRLTIVEGSALDVGAKAQGMIIVPESYYRYYNAGSSSADGILSAKVAADLAYSWFAHVSSTLDLWEGTESAWLNDAIRNYAASAYFDSRGLGEEVTFWDRLGFSMLKPDYSMDFGKNLELAYLEAVRFQGRDEPVTREYASLENPEVWETQIATKGYLLLRTLESFGGKERIFQLFKRTSELGGVGSFEVVTGERFYALAEEVFSDQGFPRFWQAFVLSDAQEDLEILSAEQVESSGGYRINLEIGSNGAVFWPVEVLLEYRDGSSETVLFDLTENTLTVWSNSPLKRATVDPRGLVLDGERLNNSYPRKANFVIMSEISPDSTTYSLAPVLEIRPEENTVNAGFALGYYNRIYNQLQFGFYYSTGQNRFLSEIEYLRNLPSGQLSFGALLSDQKPEEVGLGFEIRQKVKKNTGYAAYHNIDWFKGSFSLTYYPELNDYNLSLVAAYDFSLLQGRNVTSTFDLSKRGGRLSIEVESIKAGPFAGFIRTRLNGQTSFQSPLKRAVTTMHDVPEKTGDHALTFSASFSVPLILDKELFAIGPLVWEDAEGRLSVVAGNAWQKGSFALKATQAYLKGELLLGFNFLAKPFAVRISMARDLLGPNVYSYISLSSRFYREVLGK